MTTATASPARAPAPRTPHALDLPSLQAWLTTQVGPLAGPLTARRLPGGQSNPSWLLGAGTQTWVLRAKPGPAADLLPSAHAIEREFQVLQALAGSQVPVPPALCLCEDESVIGAAFYLMGFVEGRIFRDAALPALAPAERGAVHAEALRVLAALHRSDWRGRGLAGYGRHAGYFERLIARWTRQYRATQTQPIAAMEQLIAWLPAHLPASALNGELALTHGDFRLENMVFHPSEPKVLAVLDWELSTLGHPLGDFGYHAMAWHLPPGVLQGFGGLDHTALGLPTLAETVDRYAALAGRSDPERLRAELPFHLAVNLFRLTAILQGIAKRVQDGQASNPQAPEIAALTPQVAELGWALASGQRPPC